ncbi:FAD-binding oxidoreductase [Herbaspirillum sp. YR522]|uniref:FAD-binding oxidoreductase n=1 Tax=Herbaspirillum sp. YR522 TaxID=1144342 RepID=UPI00026FBBC5|nr:FAD-binding oxidoreductase [Herbaspirillum sp. YR522]EJN09547.1 FAD/FMN-dependent dehydrogenase [Herbaspirillum sp. YR522]
MSHDTEQLLTQLRAIVGDAGLVTDLDAQAPYLKDWLGKWQGRVAAVVRPANTAETAEVVRLCHVTHTPIVTQGGNTGMSGGATPDDSGAQVILSTTRMNRIREVDPINNTMTVDAGVILANAQQAAQEVGRYFPLSLGAEGSCTVGGNLATNAGGIAVLRFGNMRELALGLEVVLPDGRIWNGLRALRKDNTGYDLRDLFIGSEGTLGIITGAVLKLFAQSHARATAWVGADSLEQLVELLARTRARCGERLVAFEMMSAASLALVLAQVDQTRAPLAQPTVFNALVELADTEDSGLQRMLEDVLGQALEDGLIADAMFCASQAQSAALWKLREGISQAQVRAGKVIKHDIALPISSLAPFTHAAEEAIAGSGLGGCEIINFGHLGDGNLHFNVMIALSSTYDELRHATLVLNRLVHDLVARLNGSISAEHGVGQLRRDELKHYKQPLEMELMMRIKQAFDPNLIMNPGKLV